jgi:UPF0755 protein
MTSFRPLALLGLVLALGALLGIGVWLIWSTPGTVLNEEPTRLGPTLAADQETVLVTIEAGDDARTIGEKLEDAGVIESARLFRVLVGLMGLSDRLVAGEYEFQRGEPTLRIVRRISEGITSPLLVTVPEGLRLEEVAQVMEREGIVPAREFLDALDDPYSASFLNQIPPGAGLEGFLSPATYGFSRTATGHDVVQRMLQAFDERYQEEIRPRLANSELTLFEVVTLASIVEREARVPAERPVIASVFLNRLRARLPLQADPTVQYALAADPENVRQFGYWKRELTQADLAVDSPYNTYTNVGLPPGPIANPGLDAILAVLEPAETNYLFFVAQPDGSHLFAETLEEHQRNVCQVDPGRPECP